MRPNGYNFVTYGYVFWVLKLVYKREINVFYSVAFVEAFVLSFPKPESVRRDYARYSDEIFCIVIPHKQKF